MKSGRNVTNLHDKQSKETHWVSLFINKNTAVYFNSFGNEYIPPEILCVYFIVSLP